jgi:hypothetical protein
MLRVCVVAVDCVAVSARGRGSVLNIWMSVGGGSDWGSEANISSSGYSFMSMYGVAVNTQRWVKFIKFVWFILYVFYWSVFSDCMYFYNIL